MGLPTDEAELEKIHEEAWVGDAVLALWAREWILQTDGCRNGEQMVRMTSNQFLSSFGNPTMVEAEIGRVYQQQGLEAAFQFCADQFIPRFLAEEKNRQWAATQKKSRKKKRG